MSDTPEKLLIRLTDARPVRIVAADWPCLAAARQDWWNGELESQANRSSYWRLRVRRRGSQWLVYGWYEHGTQWRGEESHEHYRGERLDCGDSDEEAQVAAVIEAVKRVCSDLGDLPAYSDDASQWELLAQECIADLPAVEL